MEPYRGTFPIAPTPFLADEDLDLDGQRRALDFLIDAGVDGICILANYSEQFSLTDRERDLVLDTCLTHVGARVPVIVTTSHYSQRVAIERSVAAEAAGAAMVMVMPPYHGATLRTSLDEMREWFGALAGALSIPVMIQDAPMSGTTLSADMLAALAIEIPGVQYLKVESANAAAKLERLIAVAGDACPGPFDGEEGITLIPDLEAGATGCMPSAMLPEVISAVVNGWLDGDRGEATALWEAWLPMIHYENRQCGLRATKELMAAYGIIASACVRQPMQPLTPSIRAGLIEHARKRQPMITRWAAERG